MWCGKLVWQGGVVGNVHNGLFGVGWLDMVGIYIVGIVYSGVVWC